MRHTINTSLLSFSVILFFSLAIGAQENASAEEQLAARWEDVACFECHDAELLNFKNTSHHLLISQNQKVSEEESCALCHGDTEEHMEDPDLSNILTAKHSPLDLSRKCASCHEDAGKSNLLAINDHTDLDIVNCVSCHVSGHYEEIASPLLSSPPVKLCSSCHQSERAQFDMPFAHKDMNGPMECTECHNVHDQGELFSLTNFGSSQMCSKCHEDKAGPYLFPHAVNEIEACVACHTPHGSLTPFQLTRPTTTQLCMECHTDFFIKHRDSTLGLQSCVQCHAEIHGSQRDHLLFQP